MPSLPEDYHSETGSFDLPPIISTIRSLYLEKANFPLLFTLYPVIGCRRSNKYVIVHLLAGLMTDVLQEIETWVAALDAYDNQDFEEALRQLNRIFDVSAI